MVALATASALLPAQRRDPAGHFQVIIGFAHEARRNALPAKAGLKRLCPNPPKTCLPMIMAKNAPNIVIHQGSSGGRLKARSRPVTTALPSPTVIRRPIIRWQRASARTAAKIETAMTTSAGRPKKKTPTVAAGINAVTTDHMIPGVLFLDRIWGAGETVSCFVSITANLLILFFSLQR